MTANKARRNGAARPGDWLQVHVIGGGPPRRGQVIEVLGRESRPRYRVRWDEKHESIHYPGGGTIVERRSRRRTTS
jgi:Domain of unknown function (DUF1918)